MEATTNTRAVAGVLRPFVKEMAIGNPLKVQAIAEAKIKTDKVDSRVLAENGLREIAALAKGEKVMLERKKLETFYRELHTPSRIQANTPTPQAEETEEDFKSEFTQS
jgi:hypothetical protein